MSKSLETIKKVLIKNKRNFRKDYGVKEIGIFGSYIREENKKKSDLDILVEFEKPIDILKFLKLKRQLSDLVGIKVDLVHKGGLKPRIGKRILAEVVNI